MTASQVASQPVRHAVLDIEGDSVGYILFNDHIDTAEAALMEAVAELRDAQIEDLVLDLRYNSGGRLGIASQLSYMIAGAGPTTGQPFERLVFNDKYQDVDPYTGGPLTPIPFIPIGLGYSGPQTEGQPLPTLGLPRVFILSGANTCSASESIINGLLGVNVEVILIGERTCGKPYGFVPADNCGTTYFTIQFQGVNAQGFGDYANGFEPSLGGFTTGAPVTGCNAEDDLDNPLGDPAEARLDTALGFRQHGDCSGYWPVDPQGSADARSGIARAVAADGHVPKPVWLQNRIIER